MDSNGRVFEDFVPPHTMVREPATHTLSIDLSAAGKHAGAHRHTCFVFAYPKLHLVLPVHHLEFLIELSITLRRVQEGAHPGADGAQPPAPDRAR
jgi:hypothetical protein